MQENLINLYHEELTALNKLGNEFAKTYPKVAGTLRMGLNSIEDPLIGQLVESFAFLSARLRQVIHNGYEEINTDLLELNFPHLLRPIPSMSIVQFKPKQQFSHVYTIPKATQIMAKTPNGEICQFRTGYSNAIYPIHITAIDYEKAPYLQIYDGKNNFSKARLKVHFRLNNKTLMLDESNKINLRFYINLELEKSYQLYELLFNQLISIQWVKNNELQPNATMQIKRVGFDNEGLIPYPNKSFMGYQLLTEFFVFPEKFLFFDLQFDNNNHLWDESDYCFIFNFSEDRSLLESAIDKEALQLGCTPIINLFSHTAEPIKYDFSKEKYQLLADSHRDASSIEIYDVDKVELLTNGKKAEVIPLFSYNRKSMQTEQKISWHVTRRPSWETYGKEVNGDESYISLDYDHTDVVQQDVLLKAEVTCSNRDLPIKLGFNLDEPLFSFWDKNYDGIEAIKSVSRMTLLIRQHLNGASRWQFISHLGLNQQLFSLNENESQSFKQLLSLYDFSQTPQNQVIINSIEKIAVKQITIRHPLEGKLGFSNGLTITLTINELYKTDSVFYLFGTILAYFLRQYVSINSFVTLVLVNNKSEEIYQWKPLIGQQQLF